MKQMTQHKTWIFLLVFSLLCPLFPQKAQAVDSPWITAEAAIVIEASTGRTLYDKNADTMMVPASMTKVMTVYLIFEEIYAGNLSFDTEITITQAQRNLASSYGGGNGEIFPAGSTITVDTMLKMILLPSSCVGCIIMAEYISGSEAAFVERMNETAQKLSMNTAYENCHGYDPHYMTARSQARLLQVFIQQFPEILNYTSLTSVSYNGNTHKNTNLLLHEGYYYPEADGFKTGTIASSGHCLSATAEKDGVRIITVVLKSDGNEGRYGDSTKLLDYGFATVAELPQLFLDGENVSEARDIYEKYRKLGVNLQSVNGWVRPGEAMTRGEFAVTLMGLLQANGVLEPLQKRTDSMVSIADLSQYHGAELIERGVSLGLFPWAEQLFFPNQLLNSAEMASTLVMTGILLDLNLQQNYTNYEMLGYVQARTVKVLSSDWQNTLRRGDVLLEMERCFWA